jgi:murein DD-endopeptidase MepM/ murein hydrolase activator NlpD
MPYKHPGFRLKHPFPEPRPNSMYGWHGGADYGAEAGTAVPAEYSGTVFRSGPISGYGMAVIVKSTAANGSKFYTLYGHLGPDALPEVGAPIEAGKTLLGTVGSEAYVNSFPNAHIKGTHLHLEIIDGRFRLSKAGPLGLVSSDLTYRSNPETFDINDPKFLYEITGRPPKPGLSSGVPPGQEPAGPSMQPPRAALGRLMQPPSLNPSLISNPPLDIRLPNSEIRRFRAAGSCLHRLTSEVLYISASRRHQNKPVRSPCRHLAARAAAPAMEVLSMQKRALSTIMALVTHAAV